MLALSILLIGDEGVSIFSGMDADSLIIIVSSLLAVVLFIISWFSYKRDRRQRLLFVVGAFGLFAIKGFLIVLSDRAIPDAMWIDPAAHLLDFGILLLFFLGLIKK